MASDMVTTVVIIDASSFELQVGSASIDVRR